LHSSSDEKGVACGEYRREVHTGFWFGNRKALFEDLSINGKIILKMGLIKQNGRA
jgi:hypothetical protein